MTVLSLDLDDTLWTLGGVIEKAEQAMHEHLYRQHPAVAKAYPPERMRALAMEIAQAEPGLRHDISALRTRALERALVDGGAPGARAREIFEVFMVARHQVSFYPDTLPMLERLHGRLPLVALTNGNADVHRVGIGHYFARSFSPVDVGVPKPDRAMFEAVARHTAVPLHSIIHVGDDPERDVAGAAEHGLRAIWLNRNGDPWPDEVPEVACEEIRSLEELPGLLDH